MSIIHKRIDQDADLTVFVVEGELLADDVREAIAEFYSGPITKNVLWDLANCDVQGISSEDVRKVAEYPRKHYVSRAGGKTAIVASTDLSFGLSRMYELNTEFENLPFETMAFRTIEEALEWLSSDSPD